MTTYDDLWAAPEQPAREARVFAFPTAGTANTVQRWADKALETELNTLAAAPEGTRNDALNRAAYNLGQIVAGGALNYDHVAEQLHQAARAAGLTPGEIGPTLRSGLKAGEQQPRTAPPREDTTWTTTPTAAHGVATSPVSGQDAAATATTPAEQPWPPTTPPHPTAPTNPAHAPAAGPAPDTSSAAPATSTGTSSPNDASASADPWPAPGGIFAAPTTNDTATADSAAAATGTGAGPSPAAQPADSPEPRERTSWYFRDIVDALAGIDTQPDPTLLARQDGMRLWYPGRVNGLIGESESGKTWVAILGVLQALQEGGRVIYTDFEDSAGGIISRLRLLGATDQQLQQLRYIDPDEGLGAVQRGDFEDALTEHDPQLIILDGVNAAMTLLGLDLIDNGDATKFHQMLLKPMAKFGAAVTYIDHVPKNADGRGKGGIGAQAKRSMTTGCCLRVESTGDFATGTQARLTLTVDKDRMAKVRKVCAGAKQAGTAVLETSETSGRMWIEAPDMTPGGRQFRPTSLMEKVSRYLESLLPDGPAVSQTNIERELGGKREYVSAACTVLRDERYVRVQSGPRNAFLYTSTRPYRDEEKAAGAFRSPEGGDFE